MHSYDENKSIHEREIMVLLKKKYISFTVNFPFDIRYSGLLQAFLHDNGWLLFT